MMANGPVKSKGVRELSRNPYLSDDNVATLKPSVFAYMDILGYSEMVKRSAATGDSQNMLRKVHSALSQGRGILEDAAIKDDLPKFVEKDTYALKAFTDNVVLGWPIRSDAESEFGQAFSKLAYFQLQMALNGFFVRGAISVGDVYIDDIAVFGGALIEAYEGEGSLARDPRIVLTSSAIGPVKTHLTYYREPEFAPQTRELLCDADGQWFLNYLEETLIAEYEIGPDYDSIFSHKTMVENRLAEYSSSPSIFAKYAWVAGYHNSFCDLHSQYFEQKHKIDLQLFRAVPKLITEHWAR